MLATGLRTTASGAVAASRARAINRCMGPALRLAAGHAMVLGGADALVRSRPPGRLVFGEDSAAEVPFEIRPFLRTSNPAPLAGGRRAETAPGCPGPNRAGGPPGNALRVGSRAPLPGRVLALERARSLPGRWEERRVRSEGRSR